MMQGEGNGVPPVATWEVAHLLLGWMQHAACCWPCMCARMARECTLEWSGAMLCSASCEGEATVRGLFPRSVAGGALGGAVSLGFRLGGGCGFECSVA